MTTPAQDDFYVNYLPTPPAVRRFLRRLAPAAIALAAAAGLVVARTQPDPGNAVWESEPNEWVGTYIFTPAPALYADDAGAGSPGFMLVVQPGKHGGPTDPALANTRVRLRGTLLHRDQRRMIELADDPEAAAGNPTPPPPFTNATPITLQGEIIDPKCFLGAMKPGHGKTHKECATLCITGGIPPMFASRAPDGSIELALLCAPDATALSPDAYPFIGEPVEITGTLETAGSLRRIRLDPANIRRR